MQKLLAAFMMLVFLAGCGASSRIVKEDAVSVKVTQKVESRYTGPKRRVAVVEFANKTVYGKRLGTSASDILVSELGKSGKFILIERERLGKIVEEQKLSLTGIIDSNTAASVGNILGASAIVVGAISNFGVDTESSGVIITQSKRQRASCTVEVRVVDVETGRVIYTDSGKGIAEKSSGTFLGIGSSSGYDETLEGEALRAAIVKLTENIISQINAAPWICHIAEIAEEKIYIDAGRLSGMEKGIKLSVFNPGKEIVSQATGLVLGREEKKVAVVEIVDFLGEDGAVIKVLEGKVQKGDLCKIYE
ncbi:MAG: CsgG/HfaB family protein [Candidatus Firestonebacteria bacterium]